jgi:hypothetical protein
VHVAGVAYASAVSRPPDPIAYHVFASLDYDFDTSLGDLDVIVRPLGPLPSDDLRYAGPLDPARIVDVEGRTVLVAAAEHLVSSKLGAGRTKDLQVRDDLEQLTRDDG